MNALTLFSPAKINLRLEILAKREDGYHEILTILQKISLYDEIYLQISPQKHISITIDDPSIPADTRNLAYKAASSLFKSQHVSQGLSITIKKSIPAGAGLGGGSSNAASVLQGVNKLLNLALSTDHLMHLAASIGADVPFFLFDNTALARGIGEKLCPVKLQERLWLLIICPNFRISTAWAYKKFKLLTKQQGNNKVKDYIKNYEHAVSLLVNDLETVVMPAYPAIKKIKSDLIRTGASGSLMSGSGSSVFGIFPSAEQAKTALSLLALPDGYRVFMVHSI